MLGRSKVVIVYSVVNRMARTVIVPQAGDPPNWDTANLPHHAKNVRAGEAVLICSLGEYRQIGESGLMKKYLGSAPQSPHCALVDLVGRVIGFVPMDPLLDAPYFREHTLVRDPNHKLQVGDFIHRFVL
jgi:hypothetical protein